MFEGDRHHQLRMLRGIKNRFGATNELALFAMEGGGLRLVTDPSQALLAGRPEAAAGSAVVAATRGSRPVLVEVQALLVKAYGPPRRVVSGLDASRVALVLAVLERHLGWRTHDMDAYFKLTGGIALEDPALDLGIAAAALSSITNKPLPTKWAVAGEIDLTGEIRPVGRLGERLHEAAQLGFTRLVTADHGHGEPPALDVASVRRLSEAMECLQLM